MTREEYIVLVEIELDKLNIKIDSLILKGKSYQHLSSEHKRLVGELR